MIARSTASILGVAWLALSAIAEGPKLPKSMSTPSTMAASARMIGDEVVLDVMVIDTITQQKVVSVVRYVDVQKTITVEVVVDGMKVPQTKIVTEKVPVMESRAVMVPAPHAFRKVTVSLKQANVYVTSTKGSKVDPKELVERLRDARPILVSQDGPVDPYHLQTVKEETLILVCPAELLAPLTPPPAVPAPRPQK